METQTTTPEAKEAAEMLDYTIRLNYSDGTFDVVTVEATSIASAISKAQAEVAEGLDSSMVLGTVDRRPQTFLAW